MTHFRNMSHMLQSQFILGVKIGTEYPIFDDSDPKTSDIGNIFSVSNSEIPIFDYSDFFQIGIGIIF